MRMVVDNDDCCPVGGWAHDSPLGSPAIDHSLAVALFDHLFKLDPNQSPFADPHLGMVGPRELLHPWCAAT